MWMASLWVEDGKCVLVVSSAALAIDLIMFLWDFWSLITLLYEVMIKALLLIKKNLLYMKMKSEYQI